MTTASHTSPAAGRLTAATAAYFAAFISLGLVNSSLGPTLPGLAEQTGSLVSQISALFIARSLGYLAGAQLGGRLYDRASGHPVMGSMLLVVAIALGAIPIIPALWGLTLALLLIGFAEGAVDVGGNTLLVWQHRERVGPFMNALHFFFGVGAFVAPILIAQALLLTGGIRGAYWLLALLVLPVSVWLLRLPAHVSRPALSAADQGGGGGLLVALVALMMFLYVGAEVSFGSWVYTYAVTLGLGTATSAAYLTSLFWGALTLGRLLSIPLAARVEPRTILLADLIGTLLSVGLIVLLPGWTPAVWIGAFGLGLSMAAIFPTVINFAGRRMAITGRVTSYFLVGASLGAMALPWLIGQLFERIGPSVVMSAILIDLLAALGLFVLMMLYARRLPVRPTVQQAAD